MPAVDPTLRRVLIVGGGASGALVAMNLLAGPRAVHVVVADRAGARGGAAYGTDETCHRLNVPAAGMSAFEDHPDDLVAWAAGQGIACAPTDYLARPAYRHYLADRLGTAARAPAAVGSSLRTVAVGVVGLARAGAAWSARLANGETVGADAVVLATGNPPPPDPLAAVGGPALDATRYVRSPWSAAVATCLDAGAPIATIGSGLTAIDVWLALRANGHRGTVHMISRRGLVPHTHRRRAQAGSPRAVELPSVARGGTTLRALVRAVRAAAAREERAGGDWRDVLAGLRASTPARWAALAPADRGRFLRHVRPFWDIHRHRMPPDVADLLARERAAGAVVVRAARVDRVVPVVEGVRLGVRPRGGPDATSILVARVVNATAPDLDLRATTTPPFAELVARGEIRPDPHGLGLDVDPDGAVRDAAGRVQPGLFALGPLCQGARLECTAIPEIRVAARALAARVFR